MNDDLNRAAALARIAAIPAAAAAALPAVAGAADLPDLAALLAFLAPVNGMIRAERVRATGIPLPRLMNRLRPWAATFADPSISHFFVGAIMEGASGNLYAGANFEYPGETPAFTVHGEGAVTTNAWLHDETAVVSLAVGGVPCGYCRQFLSEFVAPENLTIWQPDDSPYTLAEAMPRAFLPAVLGVHITPFAERHTLQLATPSDDALVLAARDAAARAHAPYTGTLAGVALRLNDGTIVTGRLAENVAFNPCMPPVQAALIALRMRGRTYADIAAAALVETDGHASQRGATRLVLGVVAPSVTLAYARAV